MRVWRGSKQTKPWEKRRRRRMAGEGGKKGSAVLYLATSGLRASARPHERLRCRSRCIRRRTHGDGTDESCAAAHLPKLGLRQPPKCYRAHLPKHLRQYVSLRWASEYTGTAACLRQVNQGTSSLDVCYLRISDVDVAIRTFIRPRILPCPQVLPVHSAVYRHRLR